MIRIHFKIDNPFSRKYTWGKDYLVFDQRISKNKSIELQISQFGLEPLFEIDFDWSSQQDHAGVSFSISILGLFFNAAIYDHRHWNYDERRWEEHDD